MADLPLPGLLPNDPRNCLSEGARRRLSDAHADADLIRTRALAAVEIRYRSQPDSELSFSEYCTTGQAATELAEAKMQAARAVLSVAKTEYRAAGKTSRELRKIMQEELEGAVNSLELTILQRDLLWQELGLYRNDASEPKADQTNPLLAHALKKPALSKRSLANIAAAKAEAVAELLNGLSRYWEFAGDDAALRQHDAQELIPLYEHYAERQYDAYAAELLPHFSEVDLYGWHLATDVTDQISNEIRPENGITPDDPISGEWTDLLRLLKDSEPEVRKELSKFLSTPSGDWEIYLGRSFQRRQLKGTDLVGKQNVSGNTKATWLLFALKYQFHLRLFANWYSFDMRLRAHLSDRLAFWEAKAHRRLAEQGDEPRTAGLDTIGENRGDPVPLDISKLLDHAQARFMDWQASLREERERRFNDLHRQDLSFGGRAVGALRICEELLVREVTKRIEIYKAVSDEYRNSEMLATPEIDKFRERVMISVRSSIGALKGRLQRDHAAGDLAPLPNPQRYVTLEANILDVVNAKLRVIATEAAIRAGDLALPVSSSAETKGGEPQPPNKNGDGDGASAAPRRKGDPTLVGGKRGVTFRTAEEYLGIGERQRQKMVKDGLLAVEGTGQNRRITVESLLKCLPPESPN